MNSVVPKFGVPSVFSTHRNVIGESSKLPSIKERNRDIDNKLKSLRSIKIQKPIEGKTTLPQMEVKSSSKKRDREDDEFQVQSLKAPRREKEDVTAHVRPVAAFRINDAVQQVAFNDRLKNSKTHFLPMKGAIYMENIEKGIKEFEGRINGPTCKSMKVGERLKMFDNRVGWGIICEITSLDVFYSFEAMLKAKGILKLLPQLAVQSQRLSREQLLNAGAAIYRGFPGSNRVAQQGVVAIGVKFLERTYNK
jgi:ASC-1-like (ASCH) protein